MNGNWTASIWNLCNRKLFQWIKQLKRREKKKCLPKIQMNIIENVNRLCATYMTLNKNDMHISCCCSTPNKADFRETYKAIEFCISVRSPWRIHSNISKTRYNTLNQSKPICIECIQMQRHVSLNSILNKHFEFWEFYWMGSGHDIRNTLVKCELHYLQQFQLEIFVRCIDNDFNQSHDQ